MAQTKATRDVVDLSIRPVLNIDINGGTIDGTSIGVSTPNEGHFTVLTINNDLTVTNLAQIGTLTAGDVNVLSSLNVSSATVVGLPPSFPTGAILAYPVITPPSSDWLVCDGLAVSRTTYATLFAIIGTTYGVGNGSTTFNLPDFRGKIPVGVNTVTLPNGINGSYSTRALAAVGGAETHTLGITEIPSHSHDFNRVGRQEHSADSESGPGRPTDSNQTSGSAGSTQPHNNVQPFRTINYIIRI